MLRTSMLAAAATTFASFAVAQTVPTGFVIDTLLATGLTASNDLCFLPDGRVLVADSAGAVTLFANGTGVLVGTVPNVESGGERGLLSIAADPGFATNGHFYVYYSSTADSFMHVDRFTCTGDLAIPTSTNLAFAGASRCVVIATLPDNAGNHNGGSVRFGPDGKLYLTVGDDAIACNAQSLTSQVGCLLRLDVSSLPPGASTVTPTFSSLDPGDNPNSAATDFSQLVLAHGLRNPFRMEIDPVTGSLYIGDVGAGAEEEYSEYDRPAVGPLPLVNFGWPWREGAVAGFSCAGTQPPGLVPPLASVSHSAGWASVMGGARYRNLGGSFDFGPAYEGNAFFLDFFAGELRRLEKTTTWAPAAPVAGQPSPTNWGSGFGSVTSLRLGPDGALWFTERNGTATLNRIRPVGPVNSVAAISGGGQIATFGDAFVQPLVVEARDTAGNPWPNAPVTFTAGAGVVLSATSPVTADANGRAQVFVLGSPTGAFTVTANAPGTLGGVSFSLFARRFQVISASNLLIFSISNKTNAVSQQMPYLVLMSYPGSPTFQTWFGPLCTDPTWPGTFAIEDSLGLYGFASLSGSFAIGAPSLTKIYTLPPGLFPGLLMSFQAIAFDQVDGWFRTNCATKQF